MREIAKYVLGIDPGIHVGIAIYNRTTESLEVVTSKELHQAFDILKHWHSNSSIEVFIENPNTWIGFGSKSSSDARLQGAGAVKQTYKHLVEFMEHYDISFTPTKLQGTMKKVDAKYFEQLTGWKGSSNSHGRDASLLCFKK